MESAEPQETSSQPLERTRIRRACDQCSRARIRCNGQQPCTRCSEYSYQCSFERPVRRRGRKAGTHHSARARDVERRSASASSSPLALPDPVDEPQPRYQHGGIPTQASEAHPGPGVRPSKPSLVHCLCQYPSLAPLLPELDGVVDLETASCLLDYYFLRPNVSLFNAASPYVLDPVIRKASLQRPRHSRQISPLLTLTILWVAAQTACLRSLLVPRKRKHICERLESLVLGHLGRKNMTRTAENYVQAASSLADVALEPYIWKCFTGEGKTPTIDGLLSCLLIAVVISGSDSKGDTLPWYHATVHLARRLNIHQLDANDSPSLSLGLSDDFTHQEAQEEKRRIFWLLFAIDRHWALSYNSMPLILDQDCKVFMPLPDHVWESPNLSLTTLTTNRVYGPQVSITGFGFYQWFLPLMTVLGDIIWMRQQQCHPRMHYTMNGWLSGDVERMLETCLNNIASLNTFEDMGANSASPMSNHNLNFGAVPWSQSQSNSEAKNAVRLYATFIIHVLHVLLHGRWDALDLLTREEQVDASQARSPTMHNDNHIISDNNNLNLFRTPLSDWITSEQFTKCSSHAIAATEVLAQILTIDPELSLIPYLFGIYLLQGSFVLLFFADRMLDVGGDPNPSVEKACETVIRAHEASFATLSVEFQRDFRKVLRKTLNNVHDARGQDDRAMASHGDLAAPGLGLARSLDSGQHGVSSSSSVGPGIWREILGLYRWTPGSSGLAI